MAHSRRGGDTARNGTAYCSVAVAALALMLVPVLAQTPVIDLTYYIYSPTLQAPIASSPMPSVLVRCDQDVPVVTPGTDPSMVVWDDPANPARVCVWVDPPPGPLRNLVPGTYWLGIVATVDGVDHQESQRVMFVKRVTGGVVIVMKNVRVL